MAFNVPHAPTRFSGVWTPATATLDWCEENYHHTPYIAEFWNTLSNFGFILSGLFGALQCHKIRKILPIRYAWLYIWMGIIGIGSLAFHATLLYSMQLMDEIPMLFSNSQMLYVLWHPDLNLKMVQWIPKRFRATPIPYYSFSVLITAMYICIPSCTVFFQASYGAMIILMAASLHFYAHQVPSGDSVKVLLRRAAIFMIFAFAIWNVDNLLCEKLRSIRSDYLPFFLQPLLQFHAWWHILSMISGIHSIVAVVMAWCKTNSQLLVKEQLVWKLQVHYNGIFPLSREPFSFAPWLATLQMEVGNGNLVHLEEYVDTVVSLPHEIQRNFTLIREHDSHVQEGNEKLYKDIDEFMALQNKEKECPIEERVDLIKRIKTVFLSTLTHCEEKVSLANQCYNSVEKHLVKMEEDLKCFEEEIRLSGYDALLEKVRIERIRQKQQMKNKKRQEEEEETESDDETDEEKRNRRIRDKQINAPSNSGNGSNKNTNNRQRRSNRSAAGVSKAEKKRLNASESAPATAASISSKKGKIEAANTEETEEEEDVNEPEEDYSKMSRAERLLRRSKPNYVSNNNKVVGDEKTMNASEQQVVEEDYNNNSNSDNQGDDEAEEDEEEASETAQNEESEPESGNEQGKDSARDLIDNSSGNEDSQRPARAQHPKAPASGKAEPLYCTCKKASHGQMVACDARDCPIEWFHYSCVGLKSLPKGKWYCKGCQEAMDAKTAAQMALGMSTRSSRRSQ